MKQNQISYKLFSGFHVTSEINMYLKDSILWKNEQVEKPKGGMVRIRYRDHDYIGTYFESTTIPLENIRKMEPKLKEKLASFCPKVKVDQHPIVVFPQTFIS
jgi:hypothetical protein